MVLIIPSTQAEYMGTGSKALERHQVGVCTSIRFQQWYTVAITRIGVEEILQSSQIAHFLWSNYWYVRIIAIFHDGEGTGHHVSPLVVTVKGTDREQVLSE